MTFRFGRMASQPAAGVRLVPVPCTSSTARNGSQAAPRYHPKAGPEPSDRGSFPDHISSRRRDGRLRPLTKTFFLLYIHAQLRRVSGRRQRAREQPQKPAGPPALPKDTTTVHPRHKQKIRTNSVSVDLDVRHRRNGGPLAAPPARVTATRKGASVKVG